MRLIFCCVLLSFSALVNAKVLDCTKLSIKNFKFSKSCSNGSFVKVNNGSQINPECVASIRLGEKEKSVYFSRPSRGTDFIGMTNGCEAREGHTVEDLPADCRIFFNFNSMKEYDHNTCVCSKIGCGQHIIQGLTEEEKTKIKATIGNLQEDKYNLTKSCNGDLQVTESQDDKGSLLVSSTNCIFRSGSSALENPTDGVERFCIDGVPSKSELKRVRENYIPRTLRLVDQGRIYAVVCVPIQKSAPDKHAPEYVENRKKLPLEAYWPKYDRTGATHEASKIDK